MNQPRLGKKILSLRKSKGFTQKELAENSNLSLRTIQRIESGEVTPRIYTTKILFSVLEYNTNIKSKKSILDDEWIQRFLQLFNLKTNTMKKLSVLSFILVLLTTSFLLSSNKLNAQKITGWHLAGSHPEKYSISLDKKVYKTAKSSASLVSNEKAIKGFATLMQVCSATNYLGKRIKMTAHIKTENVTDWAGMWMRVDDNTKNLLTFDNMSDRPIKGNTDWKPYEIVIDVPLESNIINYGVLLSKTGKIWFDDVAISIVDKDYSVTRASNIQKTPSNLNFDE